MDSTVAALKEILAMLERKLWLAKTNYAFYKGTNNATVQKLARQTVALEEAISRFDR